MLSRKMSVRLILHFPLLVARESYLPHNNSYSHKGCGGRCCCFWPQESFPLSYHPMMPYCCCDSEPYMGLKDNSFPELPSYFKNRRSGGVHELPPPISPQPGCLPMSVTSVGFRERLLAVAGSRPCCVAPDGKQDSSNITLHNRQI